MREANNFLDPVDKRKGKRLDWIIYLLALVSFALMIIVIVHNNKTSNILEGNQISQGIMIPEKQKQTNDSIVIGKEEAEEKTISEDENVLETEDEKKESVLENDDGKTMDKNIVDADDQENIENADENEKNIVVESKQIDEKKKTNMVSEKIEVEAKEKDNIVNEQEYDKQEKIKKEDVVDNKTEENIIPQNKVVEDSNIEYNWKVLNRYTAKPNDNLTISTMYKVKNGDALWRIAEKYNVRTINIIAVNKNISNPDIIVPGQTISIPNK